MFYKFAEGFSEDNFQQAVAFCVANEINPKAVVFGSHFEVTDDQQVITREFELRNGATRVWHDTCCGSTHYSKIIGRYPLKVKPETFGFDPLLDASGNVAP